MIAINMIVFAFLQHRFPLHLSVFLLLFFLCIWHWVKRLNLTKTVCSTLKGERRRLIESAFCQCRWRPDRRTYYNCTMQTFSFPLSDHPMMEPEELEQSLYHHRRRNRKKKKHLSSLAFFQFSPALLIHVNIKSWSGRVSEKHFQSICQAV